MRKLIVLSFVATAIFATPFAFASTTSVEGWPSSPEISPVCFYPLIDTNDASALHQQVVSSVESLLEKDPVLAESPLGQELVNSVRALEAKDMSEASALARDSRLRGLIEVTDRLRLDQRGVLFSSMGTAQNWLADLQLLRHPLCSCVNVGGSCTNGSENGSCLSNCISWTLPGLADVEITGACEYN